MPILPAGCLPISLQPRVEAFLKEQLNHLKSYEKRVEELENGVKNLRKERDRVQRKIDEEEIRYGRGIGVKVTEWMEGVNYTISECGDFIRDKRHAYAVFDVFSSGYLPKPGIRYRLSRKAYDITRKVSGLLQTPEEDTFSYWLGPPSMDDVFSDLGYESFASRNETMKKIMAALEDPSVRMIGLHGLSGVGKTTLAKEVAKRALEDKMFDVVIMANVTRSPDIRKIQGQIADMLGIKLDDESDTARAARIRKRLKNEKENTLIILDDLWAKLDFNMLGIPFENDEDNGQMNLEGKSHGAQSTTEEGKSLRDMNKMKTEKLASASNKMKTKETLSRYRGCEVLLISETKQVLLSQMDGKENSIFSLEVLHEKEAETLFKKMAGIDNNSEFKKLAAKIANNCNGLPMSIVTTARALKNESRSAWEDVHRKLERQKLVGAPDFSTKLSYDLLENEELKTTFLLCARMGHDALIMDLVKYCIGLGFLQGIYAVREARDRVYALVGKLKESSLLSDSYSRDRFNMQDIVRGAALSIASKEKRAFTMTKGKLEDWPDEDKLKRYAVISLQHCDIIEGFHESINCPRLTVFHIDNNGPHLEIPDDFFKGMKELKVLILIGFDLSTLPWSIRYLTKLRMLCLERCMLGKKLSIIGELKKLRILSFSGSDFEKLPTELKQLGKLQIFDLSNCSKLREIPSNVISSLISLEELYVRNNLIQWKIEEQSNQSENTILSELRHLNQLTSLHIQIPNVAHLPNNLFFDKLHSYNIVIGDLNADLEPNFKMLEKYEASRFLAIRQKDGLEIHSQKGIKMLFERVENLLLEELNGVQDVFNELNLKGFPHLKYLSIVSNSNIQSLIKSKDRQHPVKAFPKLEYLYLYNLKKMEEICFCNLSPPSFGKLKSIKIKLCDKLINVFVISVIKLLTVLETIEVSECKSLKEIVASETQSTTDEIKFPEFHELRSLTLQSLSKFNGFYSIPSTGETRKLFHEKVVVSKLERMELSSIQINKIWSDQDLPSFYFQTLIHLDVNGCGNLEYLLSFAMAKCLVNLQSLFVSECEKMRQIFRHGEASDAKVMGSIFPNLKSIKLSSMMGLSETWNSKVPSDSFGKLDILIIEECDKLVNVFPCYMVGIFRSLCNLRVTNCKSMKAIFDLDDKKRDARDVINLQDVHLEALPKLEHVWKWNKDREGILNLKNLQKVWVHKCHNLENIFPFSVAKCLPNLEYLVAWDCFGLREIVVMGEDTNTNTSSSIPFVFPKLTTIKFLELPKLKSFYPGAHELSCPALNDLSIELCDKLQPFRKEMADAQRKSVLFPTEVINNLKSMQIELGHGKSSSSYTGNYRSDNLEELHLSGLMNTEILYSFLHSSPNLKSLWLNSCSFKELVPLGRPPEIESLGVVPKLKSLTLIDLPDLEKIGFEQDTVLQRIESLILRECPLLAAIVPSSVSFTQLTNLEVVNCENLENLMAPSTAKSLVQLTTMKVITCKSLKEIVTTRGNEEQNGSKIHIDFRQLKALELVNLENLTSFSNSKHAFYLPSLEKLVVSGCPKMEKFSAEVKTTPILKKIYVGHGKKDQRSYWESNLNTTIQKMFIDKIFFEVGDELAVSDRRLDVLAVWQSEVGPKDNCFKSLKTLTLENCGIGPYAIPSKVLPCLKTLKELLVKNCNNVTAIFDTQINGSAFQLKNLKLEGLPILKHVWDNKNREGILIFQNLQQVYVSRCKDLQTLFPASLAKKLEKLKKLDISYCKEFLQIVGKEKQTAAEKTENFLFPRLTSLDLYALRELTCFYPGKFTLECPELNRLTVEQCGNLELFQSVQGALPEVHNVPSKLELLTLNWKNTELLIRNGQFPENDQLHQLNLDFDGYVNEESTLPFEKVVKAPNLETIEVSSCSGLKEIFPSQIVENRMLGRLKALLLYDLSGLLSLGLKYSSWLNTICEKLRELHVELCPSLTTLIHSQVSFSNLRELTIEECHGLKYLFKVSTAKKLVHLEEMRIKNCESMKEIVVKEQDEKTSEEIRFPRLDTIDLSFLSSLECFYSGNATLRLPSPVQVNILECPNMNVFSPGRILAKSLRGSIRVDVFSDDDLVFQDDLNPSVERVFLQQAQEHLILGFSPMLRKIWLKEIPVPDWCFSNLKSLVVEGCQFLSNAILPFHLLRFLSNLEELKVRECKSVKAVFDVKDTPIHCTGEINMGPASPLSLPLKKLTLQNLPILEHVWNKDSQGSVSLPFLEEVLVEQCTTIESLFPASVAKDKLKTLDVKQCERLVEIVANDEAATERAMEELTMFPSLTLLRLWNLPKLKCIYPGMHNLDWPMLKELDVFDCKMLKILATKSQNSPDSHPDQQAFVSVEKVTPHLEQLSLNKEDTTMIAQGQLRLDLQEIKYLKLQCFNDESDVFPYVFLSQVSLPNIKKLGVVDSAFKEIFPSQRPNMDSNTILSQLKELELNTLPRLNSIGLDPFLENLETLKVLACKCLKKLAPSTLSFSHLTALNVEQCHGLKYLFTSSSAKSLGALKTMYIMDCKSIEEIVAKEGNELDEDEMKFEQLEILSLSLLPNLGSFYKGRSTLKFPSLKDASFTQCRSMKIFSLGDVRPKNLVGKIDEDLWYGDLNVAIKGQFGEGSSQS